MKKAMGTEKHGTQVMFVRSLHTGTEEEQSSQANKERHYRHNTQGQEIVSLHSRQILRRDDAMLDLRRMGNDLSQIVQDLVILRPDITPEEFTWNIVTYSKSGKLTGIDVLYKAVAHAEAGLPMPWEVKQ